MFDQLKEFRLEHSHCRVPLYYEPNQPLADWVRRQRRLCVTGELDDERRNQLDELMGFEWVATKPLRQKASSTNCSK